MRALDPHARYSSAEVAADVFDKSVRWFYKNRVKLTDCDDFPKPISKFGQPLWSGQALIAWCNREPTRQPCAVLGDNVLSLRARQLARKG